ncbi:hypothetical protein IQ268_28510 [Oculatella sp. LEGE 06141]|uniref:hypothetical protein n=1 Tax=Oculatella sp. LEGE 06141 TaxID=1828648 RepID=UPI001881BA21|nr:hypothetical protein [Oculatella sp. LEGE 06141]MBE9182497.1 hypothetical protein [Oculatella sp. LEGE 06141]
MKEGWNWLSYTKWATVRLEFMSSDRHIIGAYEARVDGSNRVTTALDSAQPMKLKSVKQYSSEPFNQSHLALSLATVATDF